MHECVSIRYIVLTQSATHLCRCALDRMQSLQGGASRLALLGALQVLHYSAGICSIPGFEQSENPVFKTCLRMDNCSCFIGKLCSRLESTPTDVVYSHSKESILDFKGLVLGWLS